MRGDIADHARQLLFQIRLRGLQQLTECLRDFSIALNMNRTAANGAFRRRTGETQECERRTGE
jgi:hypothetical protein